MKKLPFLLILIFVFVSNTSAQAQLIKSIGLRTGWCSTKPFVWEVSNGIQSQEKIYNLNLIYIEVQTEYLQKKNFSLLTNISYIPKGYSYNSAGGSFGSFSGSSRELLLSNNADYINFILAPKLSYNLGKLSIYGLTGIHLSLLGAFDWSYYNTIYSTNPNSFSPNYEKELVLKPITWGGTIGAGIETKRNNKRINYSLQCQYLHDFSKAADYYKSYFYNGNYNSYLLNMKYQTFLLGIGIHYSFKKKDEK